MGPKVPRGLTGHSSSVKIDRMGLGNSDSPCLFTALVLFFSSLSPSLINKGPSALAMGPRQKGNSRALGDRVGSMGVPCQILPG